MAVREHISIFAKKHAKFADNVRIGWGDGSKAADPSAYDVLQRWDGSALEFLPVSDDTGAINFGDGTTDLDVKIFLGSSTVYALFDVGNARVDLSCDLIMRGAIILGDEANANVGRIASEAITGTTLSVPDAYTYGEMIELRYSFLETSNAQRQGLYLRVEAGAANSSTIRAAELVAARTSDVAVGTLEGANIASYLRVAGTAAITNAFGLTAELQADSGYAGTVTAAAALRVKVQFEDGATYTKLHAIRIDLEAVTGGGRVDALIGLGTIGGSMTARYGIDTSAIEFTNGSGNEVVLWAFKDSAGVVNYLVHDTDAATVLSVTTTDPTS